MFFTQIISINKYFGKFLTTFISIENRIEILTFKQFNFYKKNDICLVKKMNYKMVCI